LLPEIGQFIEHLLHSWSMMGIDDHYKRMFAYIYSVV